MQSEHMLKDIRPSDHMGVKPLVLSYDIECLVPEKGFPKADKDPIITIGCYSSRESRCFCVNDTPGYDSFSTEAEMLQAFLNYVILLDPDFITGHNINRFDNVYLRDRCRKLRVRFIWSRMRFRVYHQAYHDAFESKGHAGTVPSGHSRTRRY